MFPEFHLIFYFQSLMHFSLYSLLSLAVHIRRQRTSWRVGAPCLMSRRCAPPMAVYHRHAQNGIHVRLRRGIKSVHVDAFCGRLHLWASLTWEIVLNMVLSMGAQFCGARTMFNTTRWDTGSVWGFAPHNSSGGLCAAIQEMLF